MTPQVSVILPTLGRPTLKRALETVTAQSVRSIAIVVLDKPENVGAVRSMAHGHEVEILVTPGGVGPSRARNLGLATVKTEFAAYLDDDDWWEPEKVATQLSLLSDRTDAVALSRTLFHRADGTTETLPRRDPGPLEAIADYLVARRTLRFGEGFMQSSSLLGRTALLRQFKWDEAIPRHEDWDLFIRMASTGIALLSTVDPLVHVSQGTPGSLSKAHDWAQSLAWLDSHRQYMSRRTVGDFISSQLLQGSLATGHWGRASTSIAWMAKSRPHLAALIVGLSGAFRR